MTFEDNKEFWQDFIKMYEEFTCLWDTKCKAYSNKTKKKAAYEILLDKCKELNPRADKAYVLKKISSLRASFRRQYRKLNKRTEHDEYDEEAEPTLWYYDLMMFTLDEEEFQSAIYNRCSTSLSSYVEAHNLKELNSGEVQIKVEESEVIDNGLDRLKEEDADRASDSRIDGTEHNVECISQPTSPFTSSPSSPILTQERKRSNIPDKTHVALKKMKSHYTTAGMQRNAESSTQCEVFGKSVGLQLMETDTRQKIIAQKLISDILYHAKLGYLTEKTNLIF